ncbi:secreted RxLR effector protein 161-like [Apium graveolens]|uniref:secreted RxLR effector protein 161-like n=1 Tax=Apium graveolens TaxID=4045 RepID=UPI003D7A6159
MAEEFDMTDLGKVSHYLGPEVSQKQGYTEIKQESYAKKLLVRAGMGECRPTKYPMETSIQLDKDENGKVIDSIQLDKDENGKVIDPTQFKSIVGGLRYLVHIQPDIAYAVGIVSRYMERPTVLHQAAVKRILRYIKGTTNYGLIYLKGTGNHLLKGYSDSDLAGSTEDRRSTGAMVFYLNDNLITWVSQKQRCVALSSCEAEFMAATAAACQAVWLRNLLIQIT